MKEGQFVALGPVQHLKTKHLNGYTIDISCYSNTPDEDVESIVKDILDVVPGSKVSESQGRFIKFEVSKASSVGLGSTFHKLQTLKESGNVVENYSISQW